MYDETYEYSVIYDGSIGLILDQSIDNIIDTYEGDTYENSDN